MDPFIFQFKEQVGGEPSDYSSLVYDASLNLTIDKTTGEPAIKYLHLATETCTEANVEGTDSDRDRLSYLMGTETITLVDREATDSDRDRISIAMLLATETETRNHRESSDRD